MTGLLGELGCDLPADLMAATEMNAKGFFESDAITAFNDDVLASAGMTWFDPGAFSASWYASPKAPELRERGAALLVETFGRSGLFVMKDPRHCRLVPFWESVFDDLGIRPGYVCVHRDPVEVAGSMLRGGRFEPCFGQILWLRHVLEAEASTRDRPRVFVGYDQLLADWRAVTGRVAEGLRLEFPRTIRAASRGADAFLTRDLRHQRPDDPSIPQLRETSDWIAAAWDVLTRWSGSGEDAAGRDTLDDVLRALDGASGTLDPVLDATLAHFRESVAAQERAAALERSRQDEAQVRTAAQEHARQLQEALAEAQVTVRNGEAGLAVLQQAAHEAALRHAALAEALERRTAELTQARGRPMRVLRASIEARALGALSRDRSPLPARMKARFRRSAGKRDPQRHLAGEVGAVVPVVVAADAAAAGSKGALFRPHLPTVIVVSHEASRTGAPILALNMAQALVTRYNVVAICLGGGEILADFWKVSIEVHVMGHGGDGGSGLARLVEAIATRSSPLFAVVNSIESRHVLGALHACAIPSVALIHEFASYTPQAGAAFRDAFRLADEIVFSTELTIRNGLELTASVRTPRFHVLAQGRCAVPGQRGGDNAQRQAERDRMTALLRPGGQEFLVVGAGYVQIRKGVDLFIDVARRVLSTEDGRHARFAWIGAGYDPDRDTGYSAYLRDQIERAGVADRMTMLNETGEIEHVYALADAMLLSGRLDPLPNVAIDALSEGLPVICFDRTTGIADVLVEAGLREDCVADYLDTAQAAERVLRLIRSPDARRAVSEASRAHAARAFNFDAYAARVEALGLRAVAARRVREDDAATIAASPDFDPAYMMPQHLTRLGRVEAAQHYVTDNRREAEPRRPEPGFDPLAYARHLEAEGVLETDAYAEFLRRGRPAGPWLRAVIRETASAALPEGATAPRVALHLHAHYPDVVPMIVETLALNDTRPDIFVSTGDRASLDAAVAVLEGHGGRVAEARVFPNRGRDIGPLLTGFGAGLVRGYDLIGHVHTKRSALLSDRGAADRWVRFLYENMIGGVRGGAMMDRIVAAFMRDERLGIVFPADPNILAWSANERAARQFASRLEIKDLPEFFDFPIGTMFWTRAASLEPFVALDLGWDDYPSEPLPYDGTSLHVIERLFGIVAESRGLDVAVTHVAGITR